MTDNYRKCAKCGYGFHRHERITLAGTTYPTYLCPDSASESFQEPCDSEFVVGYARRSCILPAGHDGQHDYLTPTERAEWNNTPAPLYRETPVPCRNCCGRKTWNTDGLCDPCRTAPNCD
jgi:hypothetical protein